MSCRHDLALGTCKVCYPETGTLEPEGDGVSLDGPGAVDRDGVRLPLPPILIKPEEESFTPPDFEFQGVRFTWSDDGDYEPVDPPHDDLLVYVELRWIKLKRSTKYPIDAYILDKHVAKYYASVGDNPNGYDPYEHLTGKGSSHNPQEALTLAMKDYTHNLDGLAKRILAYSKKIKARSKSKKWLKVGQSPNLEVE